MCHEGTLTERPAPGVAAEELLAATMNGDMPCRSYSVAGHAGPPVLVVSDMFGPNQFYQELSRRLATAGFTAYLPNYFFRLPELTEISPQAGFARRKLLDENQALRDLDVMVTEAARRHNGSRVATMGFCMGGTQVLDLAVLRDSVVTVCFYGFPARTASATAMTAPAPIESVGRMSGPILGYWGDQDSAVGLRNVEAFIEAAHNAGVDLEAHVLPGLGHGFMSMLSAAPDSPERAQAEHAWQRSSRFLATHLSASHVHD
jgi:carboxymethylenebutenolidase